MTTKEIKRTSLQVHPRIRDRLAQHGRMLESFEDLIIRLLDERELTPEMVASIHAGARACPTCGTHFAAPCR